MGCCQSTSNADRSPHPEPSAIHDAASANAAGSQPVPDFPSSARHNAPVANSNNSYRRQSYISSSPSNVPPNVRIRSPSPVPQSPRNVSPRQPPWTRAHLVRQREIFFETRVAGRVEIWEVLRCVADALVQGRRAEAQALLDAACITCPSGRVAKGRGRDRVKGGVYDERGRLYEVPDWVVRDPDDLLEGDDETEIATMAETGEGVMEEKDMDVLDDEDGEGGGGGGGGDGDGADDEIKPSVLRRTTTTSTTAKGKGRASDAAILGGAGGEPIRVRVRFSSGVADVEVSLQSRQTVATLHRLLRERLGPAQRVRLVYLGKVLEPSKTLAEQGWKTGDVLSALVADVSPEEITSSGQ